VDAAIDFAWGDGAPLPGMNGDTFSVRWTGRLQPPVSGVYTFSTVSDDGVRLFLGGKPLIDNWTDHAETEDTASVQLEAGKQYEITVLYYENGGGATLRLLWSWPGHNKVAVPKEALYHRRSATKALPQP
ncbi:MAG: PA14 domain-containing protein, partial [Planctomycetota bacterium]|nr:PA14 domain-containing protein [Planctomycetota bacterium]